MIEITPERSAVLLADARRFAGIKATAWPDELQHKQLAALLTGGFRDKRAEYDKWRGRIIDAMNSGALGVRRQSQPPILVTRDAEYLTEYGSFKKATFRAFDSIGPARLVYQEQVKRSDILYIGRDQCAAWLRAIEEPPNEYVRAWLGDTWQEEAPKVGAGRTASDWKETARTIGEQWMLKQEKETGERPTIKEIAAHVADELSTRDIRGPRGKYPDAETIKREALKGITGRKKGDNLRR